MCACVVRVFVVLWILQSRRGARTSMWLREGYACAYVCILVYFSKGVRKGSQLESDTSMYLNISTVCIFILNINGPCTLGHGGVRK